MRFTSVNQNILLKYEKYYFYFAKNKSNAANVFLVDFLMIFFVSLKEAKILAGCKQRAKHTFDDQLLMVQWGYSSSF